MKTPSTSPTPRRADRLIQERVHDPYKTKHKLPEPTVCPVCRAVFHSGRWQWAESWPADAHEETCQACHRVHDDYPAGTVVLRGGFARAHKEDLLRLARNEEREENGEHPLHRIMRIEEGPEEIVIKTTDIHLPCRIGGAIHHAFKGDVNTQYDEEGYFAHVTWIRET